MAMNYSAVVFDLDGTLLDSIADVGDAVNSVLKQWGLPLHSLESYKKFIGDGLRLLVARALPEDRRTEDMILRCMDGFNDHYQKNWKDKTRPYPGVPEMLDELARLGVTMSIFSNKPHAFVTQIVPALLPHWVFDSVIGQRTGVPKKPDPAGALEIADRSGLAPSAFLYLGDSGVDMKTAIAAGMFPVGALWGFRAADELTAGGCACLIHHPLEFVSIARDGGSPGSEPPTS